MGVGPSVAYAVMASHFVREDLAALHALRDELVSIEGRPPGTPAPRYWLNERDFELYDEFFGARIGWKWLAVLDELEARGRVRPARTILDWGCGTGVAARSWLGRAVDVGGAERLVLWDRDADARTFARERVAEAHPELEIVEAARPPEDTDDAFDLLLLSHVLDELEEGEVDAVLALARRARAVVWVEPGSRVTSRRLGVLRDELLGDFDVLAPCTHRASCGMLAEGMDRHWCHFFARPAPEAFTEGRWVEFGRELGVDLRSVPYSFLALVRRDEVDVPASGARLLGRPRVQRGRALLDVCDADGVHDVTMLQRLDKPLFKQLERTAGESWVLDLELEGDRITRIARL